MRPCGDRARQSPSFLPPPEKVGLILDVACGIGTQSLALAAIGYSVEGSDISAVEIARAQREAASRGLKCSFRVDDMRIVRVHRLVDTVPSLQWIMPCHISIAMTTFSQLSQLCDRAYDPVARPSSAFVAT